jgi:hypothetical protein
MKDFIEVRIIAAVRKLLTGKVNETLCAMKSQVPLIEFTDYHGGSVVVPVITLATCERTEKERVIRQDAYSITVSFTFSDTSESELYCYAYSGAVGRAVYDDPTLGGVVDKAVITGKKYVSPRKHHCRDDWEVIISIRLTIEGMK